jgi:hypothetical protein
VPPTHDAGVVLPTVSDPLALGIDFASSGKALAPFPAGLRLHVLQCVWQI